MNFDLNIVPFSRRESFLAISLLTAAVLVVGFLFYFRWIRPILSNGLRSR
ncbi:hypothetical protein [Cohnella silvisoli]|uniref:Uncharacterized protein n=1 Tax=Cohnella silvisoli TaxID=2873699 RepID=A0ABV1KLI5_9BACL|nr:hypothetical protein [Cohnella silvisoli]MCD9020675.1 hypothetical protein [Cohnella silvisoli]